MLYKIPVCFLVMLFGVSGAVLGQKKSLFPADEKPQLVSKQFAFTEGPAVDKAGNIFFTDQPNNKIWKYDINGKLSVFMDYAGRANGTYLNSKGDLIACADEYNQIWQISPDKKVKVLLKDYKGKLINGPNDLWVNKQDAIYFTDPYFKREYWKRTQPEISQLVYVLLKGKDTPIPLDTLIKPNGIVGTPDGKHLFVADIGAGKIYKYDIGLDGRLYNRKLFFNHTADGMTLDEQGNLYLAGNGVTIVDSRGQQIEHIDIPEPWSANVCFGGKDKNVLFITASKAVYTLKMNVKGVE